MRSARFDSEALAAGGASELIGVDEAGRGPLAGPVVVAAVRLDGPRATGLSGVRDSKLLTLAQREAVLPAILARARSVSVAWAHPREIERLNILKATLLAMRRAVLRIPSGGLVLVDGPHAIPELGRPQRPVVDGDRLSLSIGCASIVAKIVRDRWMARLDRRYPGYGFAAHKGYGTERHLEALRRLGVSPIHRRTYAPVRDALVG